MPIRNIYVQPVFDFISIFCSLYLYNWYQPLVTLYTAELRLKEFSKLISVGVLMC